MNIQTFVLSRGGDFRVFQVAFYKVTPEAPTDYLVTKMSGRLPSGTVAEFMKSGEWFTDLMAFAGREKHERGGAALTKDETQNLLHQWRRRQAQHGFSDEREYMNGIRQIKKQSQPTPGGK